MRGRPTASLARALAASFAALCALSVARPSSAAPDYSKYDRETIAEAKDALGVEIDPAPEGKLDRSTFSRRAIRSPSSSSTS